VEYRRSNQVYDDVIDGSSDLGLVAFPQARKLIKVDPFRKDRLVLVCSPKHHLAARKEIEKWSGRQFDPQIVRVFLAMPDNIWEDLRKDIDGQTMRFPHHLAAGKSSR